MKKNLLYLASGPYNPVYENLNYDKIYLVDRNFSKRNLPANYKVELLQMDALEAIDFLKKNEIKIDCFVSLNDGYFEGGGSYFIFSDFLLGYLSPILRDEIIVITDMKYHGTCGIKASVNRMDWGFVKSKIDLKHPDYIFPSIFSWSYFSSRMPNDPNFGSVFKLNRNKKSNSKTLENGLKINLIHDSIWNYENNLDLLGLNIESKAYMGRPYRTVNDFFFKSKSNTLKIRNLKFAEILDYCTENKVKKLGLTPWLGGDYKPLIKDLNELKLGFPEEISFCHLQKDNFKDIYQTLNLSLSAKL